MDRSPLQLNTIPAEMPAWEQYSPCDAAEDVGAVDETCLTERRSSRAVENPRAI